ncbi:recombinase family protein [Devosia sp. 2618]|uniref:recombinase family protein n=1 Tax=Devosia sp. 2618 TaxID=3156454 RepID=UPI0033977B59
MTQSPLAYSYVRMSTKEQIKGDSLRRQVEASEKYARANGLTLVEDFKLHDIGVSAFKGANATKGALSVFLSEVESGKVPAGSYLLVESLDRLSRDKIRSAMQLLWDITQAGINVVTLLDNQIYRAGQDDLQSLIVSIVVMSRANEESQMKSLRVSSAWEKKRANLSVRKLTKQCPAWLTLSDDGTAFVVDTAKATIVHQIYDLALQGMGTHSIVRMLNADGLIPFGRSDGWHESYVQKILKNRAVLGEFQPHRNIDGIRSPIGDPIIGYYPAVISESVFLQVQAARRGRSVGGGGRKGATNLNLFSRIATCAYCGGKMRLVNKGEGPKGGKYLKCSDALRKIGCTVAEGWRYDAFENSFFTFVEQVNLAELLKGDGPNNDRERISGEIVAIEERIRLLGSRRDRTFALVEQSDLSVAYIRDRLEEVETALKAERAALDAAKAMQAAAESKETPVADLTAAIAQLQALAGDEAFQVRSNLAHHLSQLVVSLRLAVRGKEATRPQLADFLAKHEPDAAYRDELMAHIRAVDKAHGLDNPTFTVAFKGNVVRIVTVDQRQPSTLIQVADVNDDATVVQNELTGTRWSPNG